MLKNRLIPCIFLRGDIVVQSFGFEKYLPIGRIDAAVEFFSNWDVDEVVIIDIDATRNGRCFNSEVIHKAISKCFIPLTVGGGIRTLNDVSIALNSGADKVSINTQMFENPQFIVKAAKVFGSQCITVSVDAKKVGKDHFVFVNNGKKNTGYKVEDYCKKIEKHGAGEILINSIDRDGSREGYDLDLLKKVSSAVNLPVIALGGVGKFSDLSEAVLKGGCQAVAAANIFQHTEHSTIAAKSMMLKMGVDVRLASEVRYHNILFDDMDRPLYLKDFEE